MSMVYADIGLLAYANGLMYSAQNNPGVTKSGKQKAAERMRDTNAPGE